MEIVGHEKIREKLKNLVKTEKVGHAYLFCGKSGIGKKLVAIEFIKSIMCMQNNDGLACGKCISCNTFFNNSDFKIIQPEKNIIKVDQIREMAKEIYLKPTISKRKCFIIDDADLMNDSAQNALLKILEEPPTYATIILITSSKERLLGTIKSRVVAIEFSNLKENEIQKILGEDYSKEIIQYAAGSVGRAMELADNNYINIAVEIVKAFKTKNFLNINREVEKIKSDKNLKASIGDILEAVNLVCYKNLKTDIEKYVEIIGIVNETNKNIQRNANLDLALDNMILQICF